MENIELSGLRREFGRNKKIPKRYERAILYALSYYPELRHTRITFEIKKKGKVPYQTTCTFPSLFRPAAKREYCIGILEKAKPPLKEALLMYLPEEAQIGVIAHELGHVVQCNARSSLQLLEMMLCYPFPSPRKNIERSADMSVIQHGLGKALYRHAVYIRSIPGYVEERQEINRYYLKPGEIMEYLQNYRERERRKNRDDGFIVA